MRVLDKIWNYMIIRYKKVTIGNGVQIVGRLFIHGRKLGISIGNDTKIYSKPSINPTSGFSHTYLRTEGNGKIIIGNNVGISHANITAFNCIKIEDDVLIGSGVKIWDTDFHSLNYIDRASGDNNTIIRPILIKKGAFVGACSIILKGVTIGENSVIGAGSVVTKDVPDNEVWAGNPARFVKNL